MKTFEQKILIRKAQTVVDKYKEYNLNTIEVTQSYDPKMKIRVLQKIIVDTNAYKMSAFLNELDAKYKTERRRVKNERRGSKKVLLPAQVKKIVQSQKIKTDRVMESLYYKIGIDYFENKMKMDDIVYKYRTSLHSARQFVYKYAKKKGILIKEQKADPDKEREIVLLYEKGMSISGIEKRLRLAHRTIKKILIHNNVQLHSSHSEIIRVK